MHMIAVEVGEVLAWVIIGTIVLSYPGALYVLFRGDRSDLGLKGLCLAWLSTPVMFFFLGSETWTVYVGYAGVAMCVAGFVLFVTGLFTG
jgi:hypothetical protein